MNRSSWKLPYLSNSVFRLFNKSNDKPNLVWSRSSTFLFPHLGKTFKVYNGKKFVSIQVKKPLLGHYVGDFCMSKMLGRKIHLRKKKIKKLTKNSMGHLVNPIGIRLNHSLTWVDSWNATNKIHYFNYYSNVVLARTYLNFFFSREYVENFGIFFSHFSIFWSSNKFIVEINLYDGKIEDWIETCSASFSQDFKRLAIYSLKAFKQPSRNVEFSRSLNLDFFKFSLLLIIKFFFKTNENVLLNSYGLNSSNSPNKMARLISSLLGFLSTRSYKEDLVLKKIYIMARFILRVYCLYFYQIPFYNYLITPLKLNLFSVLGNHAHISVLGVENKNVNSVFISRFLSRKLAQKYRWAELMSSLRRELNFMTDTEKLIYGYKIQFHGRFTRRSRSEAVSTGYGRVSTSTISATIDYAISNLTLRNGSGAVKVWLYRAPRFRTFSYKIL